jgi:hypothetical protein
MKNPKTKPPTDPHKTATRLDADELVQLMVLRARHAEHQADAARIARDDQELSASIVAKYGNEGEALQLGPNGEISRTVKEAA